MSATAKVQVVASKAPDGKSSPIRIDPIEATLAVGEVVAPKVEQQLPGSDTWQEVQPDAVRWQVPTTGVVWKPPTSFKPTAGLAKGGETQVLTAEYQGQKATLTLTPATGAAASKKAAAPTGPLSIRQEPTSERRLFVGQERRFTVVAGDTPVTSGVKWTPDFEDAHVRWKDGVLTAKRGGRPQQLTAQVNGKTLTVSVTTRDEPSRVVSSAPSSSTRSRSSGSRGGSVRRPTRGGRVVGVGPNRRGVRGGYWGGPNYVWPGWVPPWWGYTGSTRSCRSSSMAARS